MVGSAAVHRRGRVNSRALAGPGGASCRQARGRARARSRACLRRAGLRAAPGPRVAAAEPPGRATGHRPLRLGSSWKARRAARAPTRRGCTTPCGRARGPGRRQAPEERGCPTASRRSGRKASRHGEARRCWGGRGASEVTTRSKSSWSRDRDRGGVRAARRLPGAAADGDDERRHQPLDSARHRAGLLRGRDPPRRCLDRRRGLVGVLTVVLVE